MSEDAPYGDIQPGALYVVATPIGNLGDLSPRALRVLAGVDRVCAEDTRVTGAMLQHFGVNARLVALHEHNEDRVAADLVAELQAGRSLALVSDAGTPLVSDPGFVLVRAARAAGIVVLAVPGPCAAVAALSISGLPSDRFLFAGFLPAKAAARRSALQGLAHASATVILYESAHRIEACLQDIVAVLGPERRLCIAREITKRFEQSLAATAARALEWLRSDADHARGEFVLVLEGSVAPSDDGAEADRVLGVLLAELEPSRAARVAAQLTGARRNALYARALALVRQGGEGEEKDEG